MLTYADGCYIYIYMCLGLLVIVALVQTRGYEGRVLNLACQHTSAYVSIRQHTSAYVSIRRHTSAYVSIRQLTSAYVSIRQHTESHLWRARTQSRRHADVSIRQHTSAYVSIRNLTCGGRGLRVADNRLEYALDLLLRYAVPHLIK